MNGITKNTHDKLKMNGITKNTHDKVWKPENAMPYARVPRIGPLWINRTQEIDCYIINNTLQ